MHKTNNKWVEKISGWDQILDELMDKFIKELWRPMPKRKQCKVGATILNRNWVQNCKWDIGSITFATLKARKFHNCHFGCDCSSGDDAFIILFNINQYHEISFKSA